MKRTWIAMGCALAGFTLTALAQQKDHVPSVGGHSGKDTAENKEIQEEVVVFDPDAKRPKQVQVQVEFIEVSHETLTKLLFLRSPKVSDATDLRKQMQDLVSKNEAKVLETQIVVCRSGQKSTTESIHEVIYPTEYEPDKVATPPTSSTDGASTTPPSTDIVCTSPATPTSFETRNVGGTLDVEPTIGDDNRLIDLRFIPEFIWHTGNTVWREGKDEIGNPFKVTMPDFYFIRINSSINCIDGQYNFVATISPKNDKGEADTTRKLMVFVKCDILTVK